MVLLACRDAAPAVADGKGPALAAREALGVALAGRAQEAAALDAGRLAPTPGPPADGQRTTHAAVLSGDSGSLDEAPLIVSGPLLPIRQPRRGLNPNRNYRVVGTQPAHGPGAPRSSQDHVEMMAVVTSPPTPVSALASTSSSASSTGSSASRSSGGDSHAAAADDGDASAHPGPASPLDSENSRASEAAMEPIVISGPHAAASLASSRRPSRSHGQPHGTELDGRAVRVSSLLPGARASPVPSYRRLPGLAEAAAAAEGSAAAQQHYLVQRVAGWTLPEHELHHAEFASHSTPQIRISSPQMRLHGHQRRSLTQSLDTLDERPAHTSTAAANGSTRSYFADTEMDGRSSSAMPDVGVSAAPRLPHAMPHATDGHTAGMRAAARQSWNTTNDDDDCDGDGDNCEYNALGARLSARQYKRRGVRASVITERFHVRPISALDAAHSGSADRAIRVLSAAIPDSPVDVPFSPGSLGLAVISAASGYRGPADRFYVASSTDDHAGLPDHAALPDHVRFPEHRRPGVARAGRLSSTYGPQGLEQRATSFDLGRIGHPAATPSSASHSTEYARPGAQGPRGRGLGGRGSASSLRFSLRGSGRGGGSSSNRLGTPPRAGGALPEKAEDGYDGDSEGLAGAGQPVPVHRRNTVSGDKINDQPGPGRRSARQQMPRNTSDYTDAPYSKDERWTVRGSRRRSTAQSLMPIGTQISPGHANYVLMYNMLTGIRVSVSRCEAKDPRPVRADDYDAQHKYSFDVVGDEMTPSSRYDFKFKDYAPWVFRCIREAFHLSTEEYLVSLTDKYILSEVGSSGKSGSFFYYSQDYRFIIKTVHHTEHKFMRQILPQYYEFVRDNPHTLLSRIYGLHRIKLPHGRKVHFIVMSNILPPNKDIHAQFDLKGSLQGRELSAELASKPRACMKDRNWLNLRQRLHLGPTKRHQFVRQLIEDVTLLIKLNIMDYSLLIGIHDLNKGNAAKLRDTTLAMFDPQTTDIQQLNRLTRAHTIRKKVVHTDPVALDALPQGTLPPLPESMFQELRHSIFYREDGGILSTDKDDCPAQLIYYLGVIDILTPYNALKRAEHVVKSVVHDGSQISAINPRKYGLRFLHFTIRSLDGCEDVLPLLEEFERTTYQDICRQLRPF